MREKTEKHATRVVIIGAGAAGFSAALELADEGYQVELLEKATLGSGASGRNPGRMGHGFHFVDINTALTYLRASIEVQKTYPGFLVGQDLPFDAPIRHGRYFITKDSDEPAEVILATYRAIQSEYQRLVDLDPDNKVFGEPGQFFRILDPSEYQDDVNVDCVEAGVETCEHLFDWSGFSKHIREKILNHPNIHLREHTEVTDISRNAPGDARFTVMAKSADGEAIALKTDYIVNSTWQDIERLNDSAGFRMIPGERTNRLKTLLTLELPESMENTHSMFFCMGLHCMISNLGNRKAMATFAKTTNLEASSDIAVSENAERLLNGGVTPEEKATWMREMIDGISYYIPKIAEAKAIDLKFGIVQTAGKLSLSELNDPTHEFRQRAESRIRAEQIGFISNPCMKLFYMVRNGKTVSEMIPEHQQATEIICSCMDLIKEKAAQQRIPFDGRIERSVLETLERYESTSLTLEHMDSIANTVINTIKNKSSLHSFWATRASSSSQPEPGERPCLP